MEPQSQENIQKSVVLSETSHKTLNQSNIQQQQQQQIQQQQQQQQIRLISSSICQTDGHQSEANVICLEKKCPKNGLICTDCLISGDHDNHQRVKLSQFQDEFANNRPKFFSYLKYISKQEKQNKEKLIEGFKVVWTEFETMLTNQLESIEEKSQDFMDYFDQQQQHQLHPFQKIQYQEEQQQQLQQQQQTEANTQVQSQQKEQLQKQETEQQSKQQEPSNVVKNEVIIQENGSSSTHKQEENITQQQQLQDEEQQEQQKQKNEENCENVQEKTENEQQKIETEEKEKETAPFQEEKQQNQVVQQQQLYFNDEILSNNKTIKSYISYINLENKAQYDSVCENNNNNNGNAQQPTEIESKEQKMRFKQQNLELQIYQSCVYNLKQNLENLKKTINFEANKRVQNQRNQQLQQQQLPLQQQQQLQQQQNIQTSNSLNNSNIINGNKNTQKLLQSAVIINDSSSKSPVIHSYSKKDKDNQNSASSHISSQILKDESKQEKEKHVPKSRSQKASQQASNNSLGKVDLFQPGQNEKLDFEILKFGLENSKKKIEDKYNINDIQIEGLFLHYKDNANYQKMLNASTGTKHLYKSGKSITQMKMEKQKLQIAQIAQSKNSNGNISKEEQKSSKQQPQQQEEESSKKNTSEKPKQNNSEPLPLNRKRKHVEFNNKEQFFIDICVDQNDIDLEEIRKQCKTVQDTIQIQYKTLPFKIDTCLFKYEKKQEIQILADALDDKRAAQFKHSLTSEELNKLSLKNNVEKNKDFLKMVDKKGNPNEEWIKGIMASQKQYEPRVKKQLMLM